MLKPLTLTLALLISPAIAQEDLHFDRSILETCLETADASKDHESCIGLASKSCMETGIGTSGMGMPLCLDREREVWDAKLNETYQALMAKPIEIEEHGPEVPYLQQMQRDWIVARDSECQYERSLWGTGTGAGPAEIECLMKLTALRYLLLQQYLDEEV